MFSELFQQPTDAAAYFIMGSVGTILFAIRVAIMMLFGGHDGGDFDMHAGDAGGIDSHDSGFSLFSLLSILSFMMGTGWLGFAGRTEWHWGPVLTAAVASGFGFLLMLMSSYGMWQMKKFNEGGTYDITKAIGRTARVYRTIPAKGQGRGEVELDVDGRRSVIAAKSVGPQLESFSSVKVVEVLDDGSLLVEPN